MSIRIRRGPANTQESIEIIGQHADHARSMEILAANNLRPLTYQDAFSRSSELIKKLKGKWFYLAAQRGIDRRGILAFNEKGKLAELIGNESMDQKVRVWPGNNPLSLLVYSDDDARYGGRRFVLGADDEPSLVAPVVVGVKIDTEAAAKEAVRK